MDAGQIQKLLDANLEQLASRAANPRATLTALGQKIAAAIEAVEARMVDVDTRAMELPSIIETEGEKLKKLDAVIAKAQNDGRADLEQAAMARKQSQFQQVQALSQEGDALDAEAVELQTILEKLQAKQVDLDGAIALAPAGSAEPTAAPAAAPLGSKIGAAPVAAATTAPSAFPMPAPRGAPAVAAAPAAPAPRPSPAAAAPKAAPAAPAAKKGGDALDDEFAALFAAENISLDEIQLPKKKAAKPVLPESDFSIPDLVMVSENELPDDATDEDRAPIPTAPPKGAAPTKGAAPAKAAPAAAKAAPAATPAKASPAAAKPTPAATPTKAAAQAPAGKKSRTWVWVTVTVVGLGGAGAAVAHFVYGLF